MCHRRGRSAAGKAAEGLREHGHDGRIVLVGAETHLPYERPPLSKGYLLGNDELEKAFVHTRAGTTSTRSSCGWARR